MTITKALLNDAAQSWNAFAFAYFISGSLITSGIAGCVELCRAELRRLCQFRRANQETVHG